MDDRITTMVPGMILVATVAGFVSAVVMAVMGAPISMMIKGYYIAACIAALLFWVRPRVMELLGRLRILLKSGHREEPVSNDRLVS
ncbi:hypothetical protein [Frigidibacter sp. ROC022]|uniref:hypothetical protein n=1 Tax=Frigidibacter sp. ROC022 TaxID=2971796 RepID=UPI00215AE86E|nr:hypothetical protein [Frigidibacter sp. ROC022]MCR8726657.1 hypothetical protein [Frigidibacter sp. ROC022]